jgi:ABC-type dipeptide/oligopeptide/nickel transport system permease subunit
MSETRIFRPVVPPGNPFHFLRRAFTSPFVLRMFASWNARLSLLIIVMLGLVAVLAPQITPYDPRKQTVESNLPPYGMQWLGVRGTQEHWLGTDYAGRDILSRLLYGTRTAMALAILAVPIAALLGTLVGLVSGYFGGRTDAVLMRATDVINAFPAIMFAVLIVLLLRSTPAGKALNGLISLTLAFSLIAWVTLARLVRGRVLAIKQNLFVEAARSVGASHMRILFRHILPNCVSLIIVWLMAAIPKVIILETLLGYIGVGITPSVGGAEFIVTSFGGIFREGQRGIHSNPTMIITVSLAVGLLCGSFNLLGDSLRSALDPKHR